MMLGNPHNRLLSFRPPPVPIMQLFVMIDTPIKYKALIISELSIVVVPIMIFSVTIGTVAKLNPLINSIL